MKKTISLQLVPGLMILACGLVGGPLAQNSSAQTQSVPPPNTDLASTAPNSVSNAEMLPADIDPNGALAQVVRLLQAGVQESVIMTYISNSASPFDLSADDIIYLNDLGAPSEIANAMMQRDQQLQQMGVAVNAAATAPASTTESPVTQPAEVTVNYFYDTLAPYGTWVNVEGYGWCWRPTVVVYNAGWQPYCNDGHWVYTDYGWYWTSGYSWGWAAFHYGRWFQIPRYGWCWWPDTTWAPSWVCWRYNQNYCGWAPLPPHAVYQPGVGLVYNGRAVTVGFHFNLGVGAFTFVRTRDFCDREPWRHRVGARDADQIYARTENVHQFDFNRQNQTVINPGVPVRNITAMTKQPIHPVAIHYETGGTVRNHQRDQLEANGRTLVVNRPHFVGSPILSVQPKSNPPTKAGGNWNNGQNREPVVHGNQNNGPVIPARNFPHPEVNQNPAQNFNRDLQQPQTPRIGQPVAPRVVTPPPAERSGTIVNPRQNSFVPDQNQAPRQNNANNRWLSPRRQQIEQESPRNFYQNPARGNDQHFSAPPANRYSVPIQQQPGQNYRRMPQNGAGQNTQPAGHFQAQQRTVQPAATYHPSPPAPHPAQQGQNSNGR